MDLHAKLFNTATEYDIRASKRKGYNPYALGHYARGLGNIRRHVAAGHPIRAAILTEFQGQLADKMLRAVGAEISTRDECRYGYFPKLPRLADDDE